LNQAMALRRRHLCYVRLLGLCVLLMIGFALPGRWSRITAIGYNLLPLVMIRGLSEPLGIVIFGVWDRPLYRLLGLAALLSGLGCISRPSRIDPPACCCCCSGPCSWAGAPCGS